VIVSLFLFLNAHEIPHRSDSYAIVIIIPLLHIILTHPMVVVVVVGLLVVSLLLLVRCFLSCYEWLAGYVDTNADNGLVVDVHGMMQSPSINKKR
jgi:hypothetical protein